MRLALVADEYAPSRTSVAVQMRDLAAELAGQGHAPTVIVPAAGLSAPWSTSDEDGIEVLRVRAPRAKDTGHVQRALAEFRLPYAMRRGLLQSPHADTRWDGIAWYSPTIFFGPLIAWLKQRSACRAYLILRDLFPDWAVDTGVMRRGPAYFLLKAIEQQQYRAADVIGVQSPGNLGHLANWAGQGDGRRLEVLYNWLGNSGPQKVTEIPWLVELDGKTVFVYAGNMGRAQGVDCLLDLAASLADRDDAVLLFVGRGTELPELRRAAGDRSLTNVIFRDEVEPWELPSVLRRCDVGLVALDPRHTTHNIPGKFLTYLFAGLPVLARVNPGNDLIDMIDSHSVGYTSTAPSGAELADRARELLADPDRRADMGRRGRDLAVTMFSTDRAARQIVAGLRTESNGGAALQ